MQQDCLSTEGRPPANMLLHSCDLDLNMMTLTHTLELQILKMYLHAKKELSRTRFSKVRRIHTCAETGRQTVMFYLCPFFANRPRVSKTVQQPHRCNRMDYHTAFMDGNKIQSFSSLPIALKCFKYVQKSYEYSTTAYRLVSYVV